MYLTRGRIIVAPFDVLIPEQICVSEGKKVHSKQRVDTKNSPASCWRTNSVHKYRDFLFSCSEVTRSCRRSFPFRQSECISTAASSERQQNLVLKINQTFSKLLEQKDVSDSTNACLFFFFSSVTETWPNSASFSFVLFEYVYVYTDMNSIHCMRPHSRND